MKVEGPKVFKLVKTNATLDFLKNNTLSGTSWGVLFLTKSKTPCFNDYMKIVKTSADMPDIFVIFQKKCVNC